MLTDYDKAHLNSAQQLAIKNYSSAWADANARGDTNAMEQARLGAMAIRNSAGYTTSLDGSEVTGSWNPVVNESVPSYQDVLSQVQTIAQENNAIAQENAQRQWDFNREEAQKNRDWQEYMSSSAHQREVEDMKKAGLNPILSAMGGSGASTPSGSTASGSQADVDTSINGVFGQFLNTLVNSATNILTNQNSAITSENVAKIYTAMNYKIASEFPGVDKVLGSYLYSLGSGADVNNSARTLGESAKELGSDVLDFIKDPGAWLERVKKDIEAIKNSKNR